MSNNNSQTNDIYSISGVEDLSCDTAANIQGGANMDLYKDKNQTGTLLASFNQGGKSQMSPGARNQASSVRITAGVWAFYDNFQFKGASVQLGKGTHAFVGQLQDNISSFRRVS